MSDPEPAMLVFAVYPTEGDAAVVRLGGFVYGAGGPAYVERETAAWQTFLDDLAVTA